MKLKRKTQTQNDERAMFQKQSGFCIKVSFMKKISLLKFCSYHNKIRQNILCNCTKSECNHYANSKYQIIEFLLLFTDSYCSTFFKIKSPNVISKYPPKHEPTGFDTLKRDSEYSLKELHKILSASISQSDHFIK